MFGSHNTFLKFLLGSFLSLQRFGHLGRRGSGKTESDLHGVVDEPLEGGQGTDHDDPWAESLPHSSETWRIVVVRFNIKKATAANSDEY